jgi:hypothetical protein
MVAVGRMILPAVFCGCAHHRAVVVMRRDRKQRQVDRRYRYKKDGQNAFHFLEKFAQR